MSLKNSHLNIVYAYGGSYKTIAPVVRPSFCLSTMEDITDLKYTTQWAVTELNHSYLIANNLLPCTCMSEIYLHNYSNRLCVLKKSMLNLQK